MYQESNPEYNLVYQLRYPGSCSLMTEGTMRFEKARRIRVFNVEQHHEETGCETGFLFCLF
jgi:hypothetical protein